MGKSLVACFFLRHSVYEVDRRRFVDHANRPCRGKSISACTIRRVVFACDGNTTRSASAALNAGEPINRPINNNYQAVKGMSEWATDRLYLA